ncbi:putative dual specificity protein phosphatase DSP8 [Camellia sinensis]|uniref:putative dual specificity protein phosphatase DSP8 n=1 Tax=Camellia sinensis TaxID=4442 RepID=UPI0010359D7B|nr:putative dual specificity protein phosphatase DSP8 [Camellia sinensis]
MKIEELDEVESDGRSYNHSDDHVSGRMIVRVDAKRALVGAGARILFYPTLLYNVFRNKIQAEFRWWDQIDQMEFDAAVITLNEPYETLVPTSLYHVSDVVCADSAAGDWEVTAQV